MRYMYKITADTIKTASIFSFMEGFFLSIVTDHYMVVIKEELYIRTILIGYVLRSY